MYVCIYVCVRMCVSLYTHNQSVCNAHKAHCDELGVGSMERQYDRGILSPIYVEANRHEVGERVAYFAVLSSDGG